MVAFTATFPSAYRSVAALHMPLGFTCSYTHTPPHPEKHTLSQKNISKNLILTFLSVELEIKKTVTYNLMCPVFQGAVALKLKDYKSDFAKPPQLNDS